MTEAWVKTGYMDGGNNFKGTWLGTLASDPTIAPRRAIERAPQGARFFGPRAPARDPLAPSNLREDALGLRASGTGNTVMKTPIRTLLASALLCAPAFATAAPATLSPEQAFDLYARVLLEDDAAATGTLNDALKPAHWPNPGSPCSPAPAPR
ncbi:hypothetical protein G6F63_014288 [Rhizopus arrhizus]|nr:hypothetical protein G6F63_014288 [Rhizopus arrhizus]